MGISTQTELGPETVQALIVPNIRVYSEQKLAGPLSSSNTNPLKREEAQKVEEALQVRAAIAD